MESRQLRVDQSKPLNSQERAWILSRGGTVNDQVYRKDQIGGAGPSVHDNAAHEPDYMDINDLVAMSIALGRL
jgi:hypothetical protein